MKCNNIKPIDYLFHALYAKDPWYSNTITN